MASASALDTSALVLTDDPGRLAVAVRALVHELARVGGSVSARTLALLLDDATDVDGVIDLLEQRAGQLAARAGAELVDVRTHETAAERRRRLDRERKARLRGLPPCGVKINLAPSSSFSTDGEGVSPADKAEMSAVGADISANVRSDKAEMSAVGADISAAGADTAGPPAGAPALTKSFVSSSSDLGLVSRSSSPSSADLEITSSADTSRAHEPSGPDSTSAGTNAALPAAPAPPSGRRSHAGTWGLVDRFAAAFERKAQQPACWRGPTRYKPDNKGRAPNAHARNLLYDGALYALREADRLMPRAPIDERYNAVVDAFEAHIREKPWKAFPEHAAAAVGRAVKRLERLREEDAAAAQRAADEEARKSSPPDVGAALKRLRRVGT